MENLASTFLDHYVFNSTALSIAFGILYPFLKWLTRRRRLYVSPMPQYGLSDDRFALLVGGLFAAGWVAFASFVGDATTGERLGLAVYGVEIGGALYLILTAQSWRGTWVHHFMGLLASLTFLLLVCFGLALRLQDQAWPAGFLGWFVLVQVNVSFLLTVAWGFAYM